MSAPRLLTVALAQMTGEPYEPDRNRRRSLDVARRAFARGADLVVFPELVVPGYALDPDRLRAASEPVDGPTAAAWQRVAAEAGGHIAGGFCERDGDAIYNTAVVVGPEGVLLHYRKLHLFASEKHTFEPGDLGLPVADLPFGRVGMCVCYDLRFVETLRAMSLDGAELVVVPTAWLAGFDQEKWDENGMAPQANGAILQANLDQVFVACASQAGARGEYAFLGSSILVDPRGQLAVGPLPGTVEELAAATIDLDDVARAQRRSELITPRADRRTDVYGVVLGDRRL